MSAHDEVPLPGGMTTPGVVRVGDTVRGPLCSNSDYVHGLLLHLESCGFERAPRFLGVDRKGREVLTFIEEFAPPHDGFMLTRDAVRAGTTLVREVHDLTQGTPFAAGSEVAAHRNLSQPNFVFRDMVPVAIIDWDSTRPGTRVDSLGDFLWAFVHPALYGGAQRTAFRGAAPQVARVASGCPLVSEGLPRTAGRLGRRRSRHPHGPAPGRAGTTRPSA